MLADTKEVMTSRNLKRTDNTMAKRTDNTMAKRKRKAMNINTTQKHKD